MVYAARLADLERAARLRAAGFRDDPLVLVDRDLGVPGWPAGGPSSAPGWVPRPRPAGVPDWWQDDEDASQSFLAAMGVQLDGPSA
jgi:hypothetical protein